MKQYLLKLVNFGINNWIVFFAIVWQNVANKVWWYLRCKAVAVAILTVLICLCIPQISLAQTNSTINNLDEEIIYIDGNGQIRVIDTNQTGPVLVDWSSPDANFVDFAVGDFNADGDYEIVGIKGDSGGRQLVVYDPVVLPGELTGTNQTTNGIHWIELYRKNLGDLPVLIETGDFDLSVPGDEIIYVTQTGYRKSVVYILARDMSLPVESVDSEARHWIEHTQTGAFERTWQFIETGQIDALGTDEVILIDGTREPGDDDIQSKIAMFRVGDGGLAARLPFFERENRATSWRYAEIVEMNGRAGAEIATSRSLANLLPDLHVFEYDMVRGTIRDRGDGCPDRPHESLSCPDDVFSLHISPSPRWAFSADVDGNGQQVAFFLREANATPADRSRLFGIDFAETLAFNFTTSFSATTSFNGATQVYTYPVAFDSQIIDPITISDGRVLARDLVTTHWATYYDVSRLGDFIGDQNPVPTSVDVLSDLHNLWQRGEGGDTDGDGVDEVVIMRSDAIRTYAYRPNDSDHWPVRRQDLVGTNNHSLKLANLDRNGTLRFASALASADAAYTFICPACSVATMMTDDAPPPYQVEIDASQVVQFQAFATLGQAAASGQNIGNAAVGAAMVDSRALDSIALDSSVPYVDWPTAVPWLKISSPQDMATTTLTFEIVPSGLMGNELYQEAQVFVSPFGLGQEYERQITIGFLCAKNQIFLPFFD